MLLRLHAGMYEKYIAGNDDAVLLLMDQRGNEMEIRQQEIEMKTKTQEETNEKTRARIQQLHDDEDAVPRLEAKGTALKEDLAKFERLVASLQQHGKTLEGKRRDAAEDVALRESELAAEQERKAAAAAFVANQELSAADVQLMGQERTRLRAGLVAASGALTAAESSRRAAQVEVAALAAEIEKAVNEYTSKASRLRLLPKSAKYAAGRDFSLPLRTGQRAGELKAGRSLKSELKPSLAALREDWARRTHEARGRVLDAATAAEEGRELCMKQDQTNSELRQQLGALDRRRAQLQKEMDSLASVGDAKLAELAQHAQRLESETREDARHQQAAFAALASAENSIEEQKSSFQQASRRLAALLCSVLDASAASKQQAQQRVSAVHSQAGAGLQKAVHTPLPETALNEDTAADVDPARVTIVISDDVDASETAEDANAPAL